MLKYKIVEIDENIQWGETPENEVVTRKSKNVIKFKSKKEAWEYFYHRIMISSSQRDFWVNFDWNKRSVISCQSDEGGRSSITLFKWKKFETDIELGWKYNDVKYRSLKELWDAYPQFFDGCTIGTDSPFIYGDLGQVAELSIEIKNPELLSDKDEKPSSEEIDSAVKNFRRD